MLGAFRRSGASAYAQGTVPPVQKTPGRVLKGKVLGAFRRSGASAPAPGTAPPVQKTPGRVLKGKVLGAAHSTCSWYSTALVEVQFLKGKCWELLGGAAHSTCSGYSTGRGRVLKGKVSEAFGRSGSSAPALGTVPVQVQFLKRQHSTLVLAIHCNVHFRKTNLN